jgi:hypothetical protein
VIQEKEKHKVGNGIKYIVQRALVAYPFANSTIDRLPLDNKHKLMLHIHITPSAEMVSRNSNAINKQVEK